MSEIVRDGETERGSKSKRGRKGGSDTARLLRQTPAESAWRRLLHPAAPALPHRSLAAPSLPCSLSLSFPPSLAPSLPGVRPEPVSHGPAAYGEDFNR